jgi:hypothetical protein
LLPFTLLALLPFTLLALLPFTLLALLPFWLSVGICRPRESISRALGVENVFSLGFGWSAVLGPVTKRCRPERDCLNIMYDGDGWSAVNMVCVIVWYHNTVV